MQTYSDAIAMAVARNGEGPLTPETQDQLRKAQADALDGRWAAMLESLRQRAPFRNLPAVEQERAFLRLARISRSASRRKSRRPRGVFLPVPECSPGWHQIGEIGTGPFDFGSADTPHVVPAHDYNLGDNITGNSTVAVTFPKTGQIGLGAAAGGWCDIVWEPAQTFFTLQGNRASASLTKTFHVPNLASLAPGALSATCSLSLPAPFLTLVAGDPTAGGTLSTLVYICGQATIDMVACNIGQPILHGPVASKSATASQELFVEVGFGVEDADFTNDFGGNWYTGWENVEPVGQQGTSEAFELAATISQPPPTANFIVVTVSVEFSAWSSPAIQSVATVDGTGQSSGLPILTAPGFMEPYTNTSADNTASGTQPVQVTGLRLCGI